MLFYVQHALSMVMINMVVYLVNLHMEEYIESERSYIHKSLHEIQFTSFWI